METKYERWQKQGMSFYNLVQRQHLATCNNRLLLNAQEKTLCSTEDHLKRVALAADIPKCLQIAAAFVVRPAIFLLFCQLNSSIAKPLTIFYLYHGS